MTVTTDRQVDLSRFRVSLILADNRFRRFYACVPAVSGVYGLGVSLLSADVAVVVVMPGVTARRVLVCKSRTRAYWNRHDCPIKKNLPQKKIYLGVYRPACSKSLCNCFARARSHGYSRTM